MTDYLKVPTAHMVGAVQRYLGRGISPGQFLTAVICNDLKGAFGRADMDNAAAMRDWVRFFCNEVPGDAWGSPEVMKAWQRKFKEGAA